VRITCAQATRWTVEREARGIIYRLGEGYILALCIRVFQWVSEAVHGIGVGATREFAGARRVWEELRACQCLHAKGHVCIRRHARDAGGMGGERGPHSSTRSHSCLIQGLEERA